MLPKQEGMTRKMAVAETEKPTGQNKVKASGFWRGVLVGVFCLIVLITAVMYYTLNVRGLSIFIDQEKLAAAVRAKIKTRVTQELPLVLDKVAKDTAGHILAGSGAPRLTVEIGDKRLELPVETVGYLQDQFRAAAEESLRASLGKLDLAPYVNELAEEAYRMVQTTLSEEVYGKTFRFQANRWFSLPVTVQGGL